MCDGKLSSKRDVVILSIKPRRPEYPGTKYVPVSELLQEWDKLDAYYRGQLLKLTKTLTKSSSSKERKSSTKSQSSAHHHHQRHSSSKRSHKSRKDHGSVHSIDNLFGDENLFSDGADTNNNKDRLSGSNHKNSNKLLHTRSLNSLFDDEDDVEDHSDSELLPAPPPPCRSRSNSSSARKSSNFNGNLMVSIPVLSVQRNGKPLSFGKSSGRSKYFSDGESDSESGVSETEPTDEEDNCDEDSSENFLSVPRDNFKVQYGLKQKTRVALVQTQNAKSKPGGSCIAPIRVIPYKPPQAQGLNGIQIQKILYHKNDKVQVSPTTTTAQTPDKPPESSPFCVKPQPPSKAIDSHDISPRSMSSGPSPISEKNDATPKQTDFCSPKSDQGYKSSSSSTSSSSKFSPPPSISSSRMLKRPGSSAQDSHTQKPRKRTRFDTSPGYAITSSDETHNHHDPQQHRSRHSTSSKQRYNNDQHHTQEEKPLPKPLLSPSAPVNHQHQKLSIIPKNPRPVPKQTQQPTPPMPPAPPPTDTNNSVFLAPAAVSITDRIIKKASRPTPELIERQRRRQLEQAKRRSYAAQKADEHEDKESIDLSLKSFEMIWNVQLLSPLRSP